MRVVSSAEFGGLIRYGRRIHGNLLSIRWRLNRLDHPRIGLTIPKRHLKRAVDRNRIKRQLRECFRLQQHQLQPVDIIVMLMQHPTPEEQQQLCQLITEQWQPLRNSAAICC
ncbi:ribonuclease P protein component [Ectothiorhodospiraceae bacterium BW-2]|nr:ribonuclease P protein component [Ectothiorhodospiraceae bacterium BW-2]